MRGGLRRDLHQGWRWDLCRNLYWGLRRTLHQGLGWDGGRDLGRDLRRQLRRNLRLGLLRADNSIALDRSGDVIEIAFDCGYTGEQLIAIGGKGVHGLGQAPCFLRRLARLNHGFPSDG